MNEDPHRCCPGAAQLEAYNTRDLEAFASHYADDAIVATADGHTMAAGRDAIRGLYGQLFEQSHDLHVEIPSRISVGDWVIDEENASGLAAEGFPPEMRCAVAYQVKDGLITRAVLYA